MPTISRTPKTTPQLRGTPPIRELAALRKLEHFLAIQKLTPKHIPATANASGYSPLSKTFRPQYVEQCIQMITLLFESQREFDVTVVAEKSGLSLWKRRKAA